MSDSLYSLLETTAQRFPDKRSFLKRRADGSLSAYTFAELKDTVDELTAGLIVSGIACGDRVLLICDGSSHWLAVDLSIVSAGAVSVPRGTDATDEDLRYIIQHAECTMAIVQNRAVANRLRDPARRLPVPERILIIEDAQFALESGPDGLATLAAVGQKALSQLPRLVKDRLRETDPRQLATLIYTSGTTGAPKGVMLNQLGWLKAIECVASRIRFRATDRVVSLLPPWHAFERAIEYIILKHGNAFLISDISRLREELKLFKPTIFPSVPRIWESVHSGIVAKLAKESPLKQKLFHFFVNYGSVWAMEKAFLLGYERRIQRPALTRQALRRTVALLKLLALSPLYPISRVIFRPIQAALGGELRLSVSGGSALPGVVDRFLSAAGIKVLEGYGMTETSAIISIRDVDRPTPGTVGTPIPGYQIRLVDEKGGLIDRPGVKGTLWVKSEQILLGYYKRPDLDGQLFDADGFFNTGDLMFLNDRGELMFAGRAKDTIALAGGENIEPVPIEDRLLESPYIDQVMVVGDDRKTLGALIVPNFEQVKSVLGVALPVPEFWNTDDVVRKLFQKEIGRLVNRETGFKSFELLPRNCFYLMDRTFDPDLEMTRTLKLKRPVIKERLAAAIASMYE
ncbi:MAG: AMP-binding protein [Spirochaetales bacterium]|nr:AMP-binding protein [Spirochaetales bacterium]